MRLVISTTNDRLDKNDVLLQEFADAGNWKQALANVDKRLKKTNSDALLVRYTSGIRVPCSNSISR